MLGKGSLLERVNRLQSKVDSEEVYINSVFTIMKFFQISYTSVMEMPVPALKECMNYINKVAKDSEKKPMGHKHSMEGLGGKRG